ncbi:MULTISPECIES: hypothetical protein [unclassified Spirosoma]|uniref:hypothetical protein n=1 Tax=unclassified Spirosoma TaxID=2621999 RepID=UPI0009620C17|nr:MULTISPECIES: hypothetical protein [unclassified Spirosoma]MBN8823131.1 DUF4199 family protein [Spirosoma sp.]OJW73218.1 MAG: hypothetical protein BGO59_06970 [Spirosoma sp. 48-14]
MPSRFVSMVLLLAMLYAVILIVLETVAYIAEQTHTALPNFNLLSVLLSWGGVVVGFHRFAKPILLSVEKTVLAVLGVVILGGILLTGFDIGLHHYIDTDYKNRIAVKNLEASQQKMMEIETEQNVVFDDDGTESLQKFRDFFSVKGLIQTHIIGGLISSVLLAFIVLLTSSAAGRFQE